MTDPTRWGSHTPIDPVCHGRPSAASIAHAPWASQTAPWASQTAPWASQTAPWTEDPEPTEEPMNR